MYHAAALPMIMQLRFSGSTLTDDWQIVDTGSRDH